MVAQLHSLQLLMLSIAGWISRHQAEVIEHREHHDAERAHPGIGNVTIEHAPTGNGDVECRERLVGVLKHYRRAA